jgi:hypothetical protein
MHVAAGHPVQKWISRPDDDGSPYRTSRSTAPSARVDERRLVAAPALSALRPALAAAAGSRRRAARLQVASACAGRCCPVACCLLPVASLPPFLFPSRSFIARSSASPASRAHCSRSSSLIARRGFPPVSTSASVWACLPSARATASHSRRQSLLAECLLRIGSALPAANSAVSAWRRLRAWRGCREAGRRSFALRFGLGRATRSAGRTFRQGPPCQLIVAGGHGPLGLGLPVGLFGASRRLRIPSGECA